MSTAQRYAGFLTRLAIDAKTVVNGDAIRQAANRLLEMDLENIRLRADSERLDWLMRNISGAEFGRIGIVYGAGCERSHIDRAMCEQEAAHA